MAGYDEIIGHKHIIEQLKNAIRMDKVSHAYIFNGPKDSGKMMLAEAFAMALQCEENDPCGCGTCRSCHQALGHNQPDIIYTQREKAQYSVAEIREQLVGDMEIKPYSSKYKVYIVDEAEKMNPASQNAILKTIEEPPAYGVILLLTTNADLLLQTIRSRCVRLDLKSVPDQMIKEYLMEKHQIPDYQANISAAFAQGNVGRAVGLATSEEFREEKGILVNLVKKLATTPVHGIKDRIKEIDGYKDDMTEFLSLMQMWFRDVLYYKATGNVRGLIFQDEAQEIKRQAERVSYVNLQKVFESIEKAELRLKFNGNFELTIELLLLEIKEIY